MGYPKKIIPIQRFNVVELSEIRGITFYLDTTVVLAIARDEETAIIEAEREKNNGPEADHDINMEKLRDMRDQLGH